jgi:four helix bundle protein
MAGVARFEDLAAWQRCVELNTEVSALTADLEDETLRRQMRDAADSAPALIAEGFNRYTTREFIRYLRMARGELGEIQSDLESGNRRGFFAADDFERVHLLARRAMGTTTNLLKSKLRQLEEEQNAKRRRRPAR